MSATLCRCASSSAVCYDFVCLVIFLRSCESLNFSRVFVAGMVRFRAAYAAGIKIVNLLTNAVTRYLGTRLAVPAQLFYSVLFTVAYRRTFFSVVFVVIS